MDCVSKYCMSTTTKDVPTVLGTSTEHKPNWH